MAASRPVVIYRLQATDDDGLQWEWDCGGHRFRSSYNWTRDSWTLERVSQEPVAVLDEVECVSFHEGVLCSVDLVRRGWQ